MDKTLGQIAFEAVVNPDDWSAPRWGTLSEESRSKWEAIAAAVAAAVKEEDARRCDDSYLHTNEECAAAIRASIKEVK